MKEHHHDVETSNNLGRFYRNPSLDVHLQPKNLASHSTSSLLIFLEFVQVILDSWFLVILSLKQQSHTHGLLFASSMQLQPNPELSGHYNSFFMEKIIF